MQRPSSASERSGSAEKVDPVDLVDFDASVDSARSAMDRGLSKRDFQRIKQELLDLRDENIRSLVDSLPASEKSLVVSILRDMRDSGSFSSSLAFSQVWEVDFVRKPVPIQVFLDDEYYLGRFTPDYVERNGIMEWGNFDQWRRDLYKVFAPMSVCFEWLLGGSIGSGKTFTAAMGLAYVIYRMSCLRNPQRYYGLSHGTKIVFGMYSATKALASDIGYDYIRNFVEEVPYFGEKFDFNRRLEKAIHFTQHNMRVVVGSRGFHTLGANLFSLCYSGRTHAWTEDGPVLLKDLIERPRRLWTFDKARGETHLTAEPIRAVCTGVSPVYCVSFASGQTLECTANEQLLTVSHDGSRCWRRVDEVSLGELIQSSGRHKLHNADMQTVPQDGDVHRAALEALPPLLDDAYVQDEVPGRPPVRSEDESEDTSRFTTCRVSGVWASDAVHHGHTPSAAWLDECRVLGKAPGLRSSCPGRAGETAGVRSSEYQTAVEEPGVPGVSSIWYEEDAREVSFGPRMACAICGSLHGEVPRVSSTRTGPSSIPEHARTCACRMVLSARTDVGVRTMFDLLHAGRSEAQVLSGLLVGLQSAGRVSPEVAVLGVAGEAGGVRGHPRNREGHEDARTHARCQSPLLLREDARDAIARPGVRSGVHAAARAARQDPGVDRIVAIEFLGVEPVYDPVHVPDTHCFFAGTDPSRPFVVGHNTLDEANFMQQVSARNRDPNAKGQAEELYNNTQRRLRSRYLRPGGTVPGLVFLMSSKQGTEAFLERRKREGVDSGDVSSGRMLVSEYSMYEVRPLVYANSAHFYVEVGDRMYPSRVLQSATLEAAKAEARENAEIVEVPVELRSQFDADVDQALRDLAGVATYGMSPLIRERHLIHECITKKWAHPFTREQISITTRDDRMLDEFFRPEMVFRVVRSKYLPRIDPHKPRAVHVDVGITGDALGIACGHIHGMRRIKRTRTADGGVYEDVVPITYIDFMLRVTPPRAGEIDFSKVRALIFYLRDMGLPITHLSADGYQSRDLLQIMEKAGFVTQLLSMDRTDEQYMSLKQAVVDKRIAYYEHAWFIKELSMLERDLDHNKVDHPDKFDSNTPGSKDIADAVCGVHYVCSTVPMMSVTLESDSLMAGDASDILQGTDIDWSDIEAIRQGGKKR